METGRVGSGHGSCPPIGTGTWHRDRRTDKPESYIVLTIALILIYYSQFKCAYFLKIIILMFFSAQRLGIKQRSLFVNLIIVKKLKFICIKTKFVYIGR